MASRRVEMAKQLKLQGGSNTHPSNVQINTNVDDTQKSIAELINAGKAGARSLEQNRNHFQRKKMPSSFYNPRMGSSSATKPRGSSAGHSREGSSDDGGVGRHTLSPTSSAFGGSAVTSSFAMNGVQLPTNVVHQRQASAPALINYNTIDQPHHQMPFSTPSSTRSRAIPGSSSALPPVAHFHSKSLNTVTLNSHIPSASVNDAFCDSAGNGGSTLVLQNDTFADSSVSSSNVVPITHQRNVKSCDFDASGMSAIGGIQQDLAGFANGTIDSQFNNDNLNNHTYNSENFALHPHSHHTSHQQVHQPHQNLSYHQSLGGLQHGNPVFHSQQCEMSGLAGDLATGPTVGFYGNKSYQSENMYWMDPRGKSQSLDPISLTAAAEGASPLASGASPSSAITAPGSIASVNSSTTSNSQHQQQFILQQPNLDMASSSRVDDGLGPLPEGWEKSFDQNGDIYFIDHINKATTWYDPRISKEVQEESIKMRHLFLQKSNINNNNNGGGSRSINNDNHNNLQDELKRSPRMSSQQGVLTTSPQSQMLSPSQQGYENIVQPTSTNYPPHGGSPIASLDRIQQLKMERSCMLERRQQLYREGLLDGTAQQQIVEEQFFPTLSYSGGAGPAFGIASAELNSDSTMEVDFQQNNTEEIHHLDSRSIVPDFGSDLNPHEFDKYLQITDNNRQFGVMR